jgi:hypothetical protein
MQGEKRREVHRVTVPGSLFPYSFSRALVFAIFSFIAKSPNKVMNSDIIGRIEYSEKYNDDTYEYRLVILANIPQQQQPVPAV